MVNTAEDRLEVIFFGTFGEYGMNVFGGHMGLFAVWSCLNTKANINAQFTQPGFLGPGLSEKFISGAIDRTGLSEGNSLSISVFPCEAPSE